MISRNKARIKVEKAISEGTSAAWDAARNAIYRLESRNIGDDRKIADELRAKMRKADLHEEAALRKAVDAHRQQLAEQEYLSPPDVY